jgi:hypothetical protein
MYADLNTSRYGKMTRIVFYAESVTWGCVGGKAQGDTQMQHGTAMKENQRLARQDVSKGRHLKSGLQVDKFPK